MSQNATTRQPNRDGLYCLLSQGDFDMETFDDELIKFETQGAPPLPSPSDLGYIENDAARLWYGVYGSGAPVILLHGGLGHSGNWGYQVPALVEAGYRVCF